MTLNELDTKVKAAFGAGWSVVVSGRGRIKSVRVIDPKMNIYVEARLIDACAHLFDQKSRTERMASERVPGRR